MPSDAPADELTLRTGGRDIKGWQAVRVTRGCERMPSDFEVELVEQYPGDPTEIIVAPGSPCEILLGADRVLTGYIDRYAPSISAHDHAVRISGRSMCQDLVDSSAILPNMAVSGGTFLSIAQKLAEPYGITVKSQTQRADDPFRQFNVTLTETPYEIIERVARYFRVLVYDDTDGNLILADVGASSMASGFSIGDNVQSASVTFTADQRFGTYIAARMNTAIGSDIAGGPATMVTISARSKTRARPRPGSTVNPVCGSSSSSPSKSWTATTWRFREPSGR